MWPAPPPASGTAIFLGQANAGGNRPDIGAYFQDSRFTPSGYGLIATLPPGDYWVSVYVASSISGFAPPIQVFVRVQ